MTIPSVALDDEVAVEWGNAVADAINHSVLGGAAIIERATTPPGTANELRWSTIHQAMMRWTGTQWLFAHGVPNNFTFDDFIAATGLATGQPMGGGALGGAVDVPPHYGIVRMASTAVAGSGYKETLGANLSSTAGLRMRCVFSLVTVAANSRQVIGFHDQVLGDTPAVDGAYLNVNAGVASFKTTAASSGATHATTATLTAGIFYTLHVIYTAAAKVRLILIQDNGTVVLDLSMSANVPTGTTNRFNCCAGGFNATAVAVNLLDIDWIGMGYAPV